MVPQDPSLILYAESVADECAAADRDFGLPAGTTAAVLDRIVPDLDPDQHPRDLSEGQRLSLALAVILASEPAVVLLDEPTRGLDYAAKRRLVELLRDLAARGHAVVLATHDVELAAEVADRVVVLADGEVVADGSAAAVLAASPAFAPQVAKILHPLHFLTVDQVVGRHRGGLVTGRRWLRARRPMGLVMVVGVVAFGWPFLVEPGSELGQMGHGGDAPLLFVAADGPARPRAPRRDDLRRPRRQGRRGPRGARGRRRCAAGAVRRDGRPGADVLPARARRPGARPRHGLRPRGAGAARVGVPHRGRRAVDALPDDRVAWVALGAGLLPRASGRAERSLLAAYGLVSGMVYGAVMNLWFWPFMGATAPTGAGYRP